VNASIKHRAEYVLLRAAAGVAGLLPYRAALAVGCGLARLAYVLSPRIRRRGFERLKQVFGAAKTERELRLIAWISWRNLVLNGVEALHVSRMTTRWLSGVLDAEQVERVREVLRRQPGKGAVIAIPHMGNWELAGISARYLGIPITTVMRRQKNLLTDAYLNRIREQAGLEVLPTDAASFRVLARRLREGRCVAILPDLRAKGRSVRARFLNAEADLPVGMAFFAREAGAPIIPVCMIREGLARHRIEVFDPIYPDPAADRDEDYRRMTQEVMRVIDARVLQQPEQYFWFNKRWVLGEDPAEKKPADRGP
jgi:KDO2-lipid IV(A) lauroyltransferase